MCDRKGCSAPGIWRVGFTFEAVGGSSPVQAMTGVKVCRQHRDDAKVEDILTPDAIQGVQAGLAAIGRAPADPNSFKLVFERGN